MALQITPVNHKSELEGEWTTYRGVKLLIARSNNTNFKRIFRKLTKPYKKAIETDTMLEEDSIEILATALAGAVLLDWKNFPDGIEYSKENAIDLLVNDPDCFEYVQEFSGDLNNYLVEDREQLAGE